ncbi:hypothetical protein L2E82_30968 [Cichorium intybus]|uniref:Uncharacterized protein n=1 Tax=Cichorium intybus TaxID=13427 RepID=A0ACB9D283_CICIN|nr:hypothetical protein L2E82_30968 [Cichorium intybus]
MLLLVSNDDMTPLFTFDNHSSPLLTPFSPSKITTDILSPPATTTGHHQYPLSPSTTTDTKSNIKPETK